MTLNDRHHRLTWDSVIKFAQGFDPGLMVALLILMVFGSLMVYSASGQSEEKLFAQVRNLSISFGLMVLVAQVPIERLKRLAIPAYLIALILLIAVVFFGVVRNGSRRWLDLYFLFIQPSELLKIVMPMMLAWYFQFYEARITLLNFLVAIVVLLIPVTLIATQPDLGTATLVFMSGFTIIFFAGLSWRFIAGISLLTAIASPFYWQYLMTDYQKRRVIALLDPTADQLGSGFHLMQSMIAIGSGGPFGMGYLQGKQNQLDFVPEDSTDFIFSVIGEEFGLVGVTALIVLYGFILYRIMVIASNAATMFSRLFASAMAVTLFSYIFVNIGMVVGLLPVVGVPLPLVSYGGTAALTMGVMFGMVMSISKQRRLVQS